MTLTFEQRKAYFESVWHHFQKKAKTKREASNPEWLIVDGWAKRGIPLATVLQGIQETNTTRPRRTILACVPAVDQNIERWHKAVGGLKQLPEAGPFEEPFDAEAANRRKEELLSSLRRKVG